MTREERMKLYESKHNKSKVDIKVALNESLFESYFEDIVPKVKEALTKLRNVYDDFTYMEKEQEWGVDSFKYSKEHFRQVFKCLERFIEEYPTLDIEHPKLKEDVSEEEAVIIVDPVEDPINDSDVEASSETITPEENGVQNMLQFLVKDEWDAIEGYNNTIQTLLSLEGYEDMCAVLQDISDEELIHVGQLQKLLEVVNPSTENISKGEVEADEQLNANAASEEDK